MKNTDYIDDVVDLNTLTPSGEISCPYCEKAKAYVYDATGMESRPCNICKRMVLWDFDNLKAYKARVRRFAG